MPPSVRYAHLFATGSAVLGLAACPQASTDPRTLPPLVATVTAGGDAGAAEMGFSGVVTAQVQSDLDFRVPGKIVGRLVDAGQLVRRGQPLMRIDRTDLALATAAQSGVVAAARAKAEQTAADEKRCGNSSPPARCRLPPTTGPKKRSMPTVIVETLAESGAVLAARQMVEPDPRPALGRC